MELIRIFDRDFSQMGVCGRFTHLEYTEGFRESGGFSLTVPILSPAAKLFTPDGYITVPDGIMYRILSVDTDIRKGEVRVFGKGLLSFFEGSVMGEEVMMRGSSTSLLLSFARKGAANLPAALSVSSTESGAYVEHMADRSNIYDHMVSVCYLGGIGMSLEHNGERLVFSPRFTRDRTKDSSDPVSVSGQMGTFTSERLLFDLGSYKNVAVVSGAEKESGGRYTVTVRSDDIDTGDFFPDKDYFDRQMLVTFTSPLSGYMVEDSAGERALDEAAYLSAMTVSGAAALGRCRPKLRLYGTADGSAEIAVGDTVEIIDLASGVTGTALAERTVTKYTENGKTVHTELCAEVQL